MLFFPPVQNLNEQLRHYVTDYPEEGLFLPRFMDLIRFPDCCLRTFLPGHLTGSAWIIDEQALQVVLVHHRKLGRWLQPGGHADGDPDIARVAMREATEETGLSVQLLRKNLWDIDIHPIPARGDMPDHDHYDIRYLFQADSRQAPVVSSESTDVKWVHLDDLHLFTDNQSIIRMAEKTMTLKQSGAWQ